jgi:hypothetical protein
MPQTTLQTPFKTTSKPPSPMPLMLVNDIGGIVDLDHWNLGQNDDVECHCNVQMLKNVIEEVWGPINVGIDAEFRHLEAGSDEDHDVVWR